MAQDKIPEEFQVGDVIHEARKTPYSGSPMTKVENSPFNQNQTRVYFENGEIVDFYNGVPHQMQE